MKDNTSLKAAAVAALADMFARIASASPDMAALESDCIDLGHDCIATALGRALEALDDELMTTRADGLSVHDRRPRTLATEVGDVSFLARRYRDGFGCDVCLLADSLDIPYGARISPGAVEFLSWAATLSSYARASDLLARHGSRVSAASVMSVMRRCGAACAEEDAAAAESLYVDGVVPDAQRAPEEVRMEADGTWFSVQGEGAPRRFEVKAMCAYADKEERGGKTRRCEVFHHACVGAPSAFWTEALSRMGSVFDLTALKRVHLGADGEGWCAAAGRFLPRAEVTTHLDPFHVNRAVLSCFFDPKAAWKVVRVLEEGEVDSAIALLKACSAFGIAREKATARVVAYLENNRGSIGREGPSLGTMESDNQHVYGARMDSVPCAWSIRGGSDMARMLSRRASGAEIPKTTREASMSEARRAAREKRILAALDRGGAGRVLESDGKGYLPPHQATTAHLAGSSVYALYKGMSNMGRGH